jgi:UDP-glucose 4-epimerase
VTEAFGRAAPERVFHLGAQVSVRRSTADPARDAAVNVRGTVNALEAARRTGVRRLVNASTGGAIYGDGATPPAGEREPSAPKAPYGQSKLAAEGYCELYGRIHGLSTVTLRYGNVYGPRQDLHGEAGVIAIFCGRLLDGAAPAVFGDGRQTRDYVYVDDVVAANLAAAGADAGGPLNVGTGIETSVLELVAALRGLQDWPCEPEHLPERPGETRHTALDASRARDELGWSPRVRLEEGLEWTLASVRGGG